MDDFPSLGVRINYIRTRHDFRTITIFRKVEYLVMPHAIIFINNS